jgi:2-polyprenyl-3-methyl-5-hydroxy-6-metoxy-1,4-benzoquinol methylase
MNMDNTSDPSELTSSHYWDELRRGVTFHLTPDDHLEPYLKNILPINRYWSCLEIGVVPGNLLLWFTRTFDYRPYGIDYSESTNILAKQFSGIGYDVTLYKEDFLQWESPEKFNVVYSCGFIEHFNNPQTIIHKHWNLLKQGGFLIISTPALTPIQEGIRKILYSKDHFEIMLESHNREAMTLKYLKSEIEALPGSTIILARYIREMTVWIQYGQNGLKKKAELLLPFIKFFEWIFKKLRISSSLFSPQILLVAKKG